MHGVNRQQWDDSSWEKTSVSVNANPENLLKEMSKPSSHNFAYEDFSVSSGAILKKKKSGMADPRFRRVVPAGMADEIAVEARKVSESFTRAAASRDEFRPIGSDAFFSRSSKIPTFFVKKTAVKQQSENQFPTPGSEEKMCEASETCPSKITRNQNCDGYNIEELPELETPSKKEEKQKRKAEQGLLHPAKKSVSDCTLVTKNPSASEDDGGENCNRLHSFTSTTRLNKVNNWIKDFKVVPEKRRSVITVIGQTKGKSFSTVLYEINQRRKLAKELDKHALCETILQAPEKERELKNLIAKVDFMSPDGKVMYSARKVYGFRDGTTLECVKSSKCDDVTYNSSDTLKPGLMPCKMNDEIPERDVPANQTRKRKSKRTAKKPESKRMGLKGAIQVIPERVRKQTLISIVIIACALMLGITAFLLKEKRIMNYLNIGKPKARTWYDELFR